MASWICSSLAAAWSASARWTRRARRSCAARCWARAHELPHPRCERCGHPRRAATCRWCAQLPPYVRAARSAYWMPGGTAARSCTRSSTSGWPGVAEGMAERMARLAWPSDVVAERAMVVATAALRDPRARARLQPERAACARAGVTLEAPVRLDCVVRARATETQTRLTPGERLRNVSGAFRASQNARQRLAALTSCWSTTS